MTPAEAVECARLITDLWPHPPTTDVRLTLLASALEAIPSRADAARAINDLFYTERFQPTPAEIIRLFYSKATFHRGAAGVED